VWPQATEHNPGSCELTTLTLMSLNAHLLRGRRRRKMRELLFFRDKARTHKRVCLLQAIAKVLPHSPCSFSTPTSSHFYVSDPLTTACDDPISPMVRHCKNALHQQFQSKDNFYRTECRLEEGGRRKLVQINRARNFGRRPGAWLYCICFCLSR